MIVKHFLPQIVLLTVLTLQLTSVFCWTSYSKETSSDVDLVKSDLTTIKNEKEEEIDITTSTGPVQVEPVDQSLTTEADSSINSGLNSVESSTTNSPYSLRPEKQPTSFSKPASPISSPSPSSPLSTTTSTSTSTSAAANSSSLSLSTSQLNSSTPPSTTPVSRPTKNDEISESALRREETHKRKVNGNPSVDDIISGIMQLIGGNVKLSRPPITPRPGPPPQGRPILIPYPPQPPYHPHQQQGPPQLNNNNRINNRGPPKFAIVGGAPNHPGGGHYGDPHNLPPNILIGPGQGVGLPIPIPTSFNQPSHQQHSPSNQVPAIQQHPRPPDIAPSRPNYPPRETSQVSDEMESKPNEITSNYNTRKHVLIDDNHNSIVSADSSSVNHQQLKPSTTTTTTKSELNESETVNHQQSTLTTIKLKSSTATTITSTITTTKTLLQTNGVNSKINNDNNNQVSVENDFTNNQVNRSTSLESSMRPTPNQESSIQDKSTTTTTSTPELKFNSNSSLGSVPSGPVTAWLPFFVQPSVTASKPSWTGEPPPIITKPEEPSIFDITVKHKIGPNSKVSITSTNLRPTTTRPVESIPTISSSSDDSSINITSTSVYSKSSESSIETQPTTINTTRVLFPSKPASEPEPEVVYGRPANKDLAASRQTRPTQSPAVSMGRPDLYNRISVTKELPKPLIPTPVSKASTSTAMLGRPIVIPVDVDEVRPHIGGGRGSPGRGGGAVPDVITEPGQGSVFIDGKPTYFKIRPNPKPAGPTLQVGSGVTINIADNPSAAAGKGPGNPSGQQSGGGRPSSAVARRPPFRPRPNTPLVRIDTCIVGDDSTCGANLNEHCKTEIGISSCQCKPGFGRITARGMCTPVASLGVFLRLDKLGEAKVTFNRKLLDSDTEEFQYLEYEALQALNSLFTTSRLAKVFKGAKVNKFYSMGGKTVANATIELDRTNVTRSATIKRIVQQELVRVIAANNNRLGDSQLSVDASLNAVPRVDDINECANNDLNDCSKNAVCQNEFGSYRCICKPGYEDRFSGDPVKSGRQCASCSPQYCSNRGECFIVNGERECRCRGNFIGSRCDIDGEVLGVALGGSVAALIIIIITFLCLYMWNQRWKKEQQKMEAMSSGSGQTFSYVNKTQAAANYRCGLDDRARWATMTQTLPVNPNYNYYVNPEQLMATSQQHVYATPGRAQTPEALINDENCPVDSRHYPRPIRSKSRASLAPGAYSTMGYGGGSIYNETEFSTRETIYTPSHVIIPPRTKYSSYN